MSGLTSLTCSTTRSSRLAALLRATATVAVPTPHARSFRPGPRPNLQAALRLHLRPFSSSLFLQRRGLDWKSVGPEASLPAAAPGASRVLLATSTTSLASPSDSSSSSSASSSLSCCAPSASTSLPHAGAALLAAALGSLFLGSSATSKLSCQEASSPQVSLSSDGADGQGEFGACEACVRQSAQIFCGGNLVVLRDPQTLEVFLYPSSSDPVPEPAASKVVLPAPVQSVSLGVGVALFKMVGGRCALCRLNDGGSLTVDPEFPSIRCNEAVFGSSFLACRTQRGEVLVYDLTTGEATKAQGLPRASTLRGSQAGLLVEAEDGSWHVKKVSGNSGQAWTFQPVEDIWPWLRGREIAEAVALNGAAVFRFKDGRVSAGRWPEASPPSSPSSAPKEQSLTPPPLTSSSSSPSSSSSSDQSAVGSSSGPSNAFALASSVRALVGSSATDVVALLVDVPRSSADGGAGEGGEGSSDDSSDDSSDKNSNNNNSSSSSSSSSTRLEIFSLSALQQESELWEPSLVLRGDGRKIFREADTILRIAVSDRCLVAQTVGGRLLLWCLDRKGLLRSPTPEEVKLPPRDAAGPKSLHFESL